MKICSSFRMVNICIPSAMIEEVMIRERKAYLEKNKETRANGYYLRSPKTILGEMELVGSSVSASFISSSADIADSVIEEFRNRTLSLIIILCFT